MSPMLDQIALGKPTPTTAAISAIDPVSPIDLLNTYAPLFIAAFIVTVLVTPLVGKVAEAFGVVDQPDFKRKAHTQPIAYLGGLAVFAGLMAAIGLSYVMM